MPFREFLTACSKGDQMAVFWLLYRLQNRAEHKLTRDFWTFFAQPLRPSPWRLCGTRRSDCRRAGAASRPARSLHLPVCRDWYGMPHLPERHHRRGGWPGPCHRGWLPDRRRGCAGREHSNWESRKNRSGSGDSAKSSRWLYRSGAAAPHSGKRN